MLTYLFGPILATLPAPWRRALPWFAEIPWGKAAALSGLAELLSALVALMYWYSYAMTAWVGNAVAVGLTGQNGPEVSPQAIGGVALMIWATHPLTWLLGFAGIEGSLRLCAGAFAGSPCGILPLYLIDKIVIGPFRRRNPAMANAGGGIRNNVSSYAGAIREKITLATLPEVPDEIRTRNTASAEILEIFGSRRKPGWTPPRVVRYLDSYYSLEEESSGSGSRPFRYRLRRLPTGVPGRTVLLYAPADAVIRNAS
ncbi:MAG: hypothetical protein LAO08_05870 [Acidobacteriia bacterium]|nr:hypothetical protein [Terriglobia bacterium]